MGFVAHWAAVALHFVLNANCSVLLQLQLNESNGTFPFKPTVLALYIELLKLGVTLGLLVLEEGGFSSILPKLRKSKGVMRYLVPAVLYSVVNNGGVLAMLYLQPLEAMMLGQLRVVFTVLLSRWILKLQFGWVQWASLLLLISGSVQLQGVGCYHPSADDAGSKLQPGPHDDTQILGIGIMCIVCLSSAAACVYTQALLATDESINIANIKMYGFGVLVNLIAYTFDTSNIGEATDGSLTFYGVAYIINLTFVGIAISRILKHAGAIVKLFSYAASAVLVYVYSEYLGFPQRTSAATTLFAAISVFAGLFIFTLSAEAPRKRPWAGTGGPGSALEQTLEPSTDAGTE